ncbi:hypothetical protein BJ973_008466 [Actinoplanes tereljensis]
MIGPVRLTLDDVADYPEDFYYELLDGEVVPIPMTRDRDAIHTADHPYR